MHCFTSMQGSRLAQPSFSNGEAITLLNQFTPNFESDSNHIWLGARRVANNNPNWRYLEGQQGGFGDGSVGPWGKNQPDDRSTGGACQCGLAMARLKTWPSRGFHDSQYAARGRALCEIPLD